MRRNVLFALNLNALNRIAHANSWQHGAIRASAQTKEKHLGSIS